MVKMASIPLQLAASRMLLAKNAELSPTVELARAYIEAFCRILDHVLQKMGWEEMMCPCDTCRTLKYMTIIRQSLTVLSEEQNGIQLLDLQLLVFQFRGELPSICQRLGSMLVYLRVLRTKLWLMSLPSFDLDTLLPLAIFGGVALAAVHYIVPWPSQASELPDIRKGTEVASKLVPDAAKAIFLASTLLCASSSSMSGGPHHEIFGDEAFDYVRKRFCIEQDVLMDAIMGMAVGDGDFPSMEDEKWRVIRALSGGFHVAPNHDLPLAEIV